MSRKNWCAVPVEKQFYKLGAVLLSLYEFLLTVLGLVCIVLLSCVYFYIMCIVCIAVLYTVVAGLLARGHYPEGPATGHLGTGLLGFPVSVYKRMLR